MRRARTDSRRPPRSPASEHPLLDDDSQDPFGADAASPPLLAFHRVVSCCQDATRQVTILDRISFQLAQGESAGLYGAPKSGKSTLLKLAAAIELAYAGTVRFEGVDVARIGVAQRARLLRDRIGLIVDDAWRPSAGETVLDHVAVALGSKGVAMRHARRLAIAQLDEVQVARLAAESACGLSLTDRARVMLATALVRQPSLLLIDEPAPLPSVTERERLIALIRQIAARRGIALLLAAEDLASLQGLHCLMSLSQGRLLTTKVQGATVVEMRSRRASAAERP